VVAVIAAEEVPVSRQRRGRGRPRQAIWASLPEESNRNDDPSARVSQVEIL